MKTADDILQFILKEGEAWIDLEDTVDRVTHGSGQREIQKAGVAWMPTMRVIQRAADAGCQLLVVHEPIIWNHRDLDSKSVDPTRSAMKRKFLDDHNITVVRCHDLWDRYPERGVCDYWPKLLGFNSYTKKPYSDGTQFALCELPKGTTLQAVGQQIAQKTARYGQQFIPMVGDPNMPVEKLMLNVGAWGSNAQLMAEARDEFGAQAVAATEISWWRDAGWALDTGFGLLQVNHGVSECATIESLYHFLKEQFLDIEWTFFTEAAPYLMVGPDGPAPRDESTKDWQTTKYIIGAP